MPRLPPLTAEQCIEIALARHKHFTPPGKQRQSAVTPYGVLHKMKKTWSNYATPSLSRAVARAMLEGLVAVQRANPAGQPVDDLELSLYKEFRELQMIRVVDLGPSHRPRGQASAVSESPESADEGDRVHTVLGAAMSSIVMTGRFIRKGERLGLGSGRGVFRFVSAVKTRGALIRAEDVHLHSLTGSVYASNHSQSAIELMDADVNTTLMGSVVPESRTCLSNSLIALSDEKTAAREYRRSGLFALESQAAAPTLAIVGVGVFGPGHAFYDAAKKENRTAQGRERGLALEPVLGQVRELKLICDNVANRAEGWRPVGDINNRLFLLTPATRREKDAIEGSKERIDQLLRHINSRLIAVQPQVLSSIPEIYLIAGTEAKARVIEAVLASRDAALKIYATGQGTSPIDTRLRVRGLVTDSGAARKILAERLV